MGGTRDVHLPSLWPASSSGTERQTVLALQKLEIAHDRLSAPCHVALSWYMFRGIHHRQRGWHTAQTMPQRPQKRPRKFRVARPGQLEARDEGPRLIPLPDERPNEEHTAKLQHYINLADIALKTPRADKAR
jgi:hypothetical protein